MEVLEFGNEVDTTEDMYLYIPEYKHIIRLGRGGDPEIDDEDMKKGYKDYITYTVFKRNQIFEEVDYNDIKVKHFITNQEHPVSEHISMVLHDFYDKNVDYIILE